MNAQHNQPEVKPADRLGLALFFAVIFHALLVLGLGFSLPEPDDGRGERPMLEVTVAPTPSRETPDEADYLAQADQEGGGTTDEPVRPMSPVFSPEITDQEGLAPEPVAPPPESDPPEVRHETILAQPDARLDMPSDPEPVESAEPELEPEPAPQPEQPRELPTAAQLIDRSMEIATLSSELQDAWQAYSERPRQRFISARTREYKYASYMESWIAKVERIGNLNYPEEARRRNLTGRLLLDVALKPDGSIHEISLLRSSGHRALDEAAKRIVRMAAPFPEFPDEIRKETDILHITRTWEFLSSNELYSR